MSNTGEGKVGWLRRVLDRLDKLEPHHPGYVPDAGLCTLVELLPTEYDMPGTGHE